MIKKILFSLLIFCLTAVVYTLYHGFQPCYDVRLKVVNNLDYPVKVIITDTKQQYIYIEGAVAANHNAMKRVSVIGGDAYSIRVYSNESTVIFKEELGYSEPMGDIEDHIIIDESGIRLDNKTYPFIFYLIESFNNLARCVI